MYKEHLIKNILMIHDTLKYAFFPLLNDSCNILATLKYSWEHINESKVFHTFELYEFLPACYIPRLCDFKMLKVIDLQKIMQSSQSYITRLSNIFCRTDMNRNNNVSMTLKSITMFFKNDPHSNDMTKLPNSLYYRSWICAHSSAYLPNCFLHTKAWLLTLAHCWPGRLKKVMCTYRNLGIFMSSRSVPSLAASLWSLW